MKLKIILYVTAIFFLSTSYAETQDSIFVTISADTVQIWNTGAYENCGSLFKTDIALSNDTIYVTETDTSTNWAFCDCYFDLSETITGLIGGNYFVEVHRKFRRFPDTTFYIGSTSFTYGGSSLSFVTQSYQSDCYYPSQVQEDEAIPKEYLLSQNYPNPFNPVTTINYSIPTSPFNPSPYKGEGQRERLVTLKVYDILGNVFATLVNEEKPAGSYNVNFDASKLSSGVYFYRLQVVDTESSSGQGFIQTKKMMLLK